MRKYLVTMLAVVSLASSVCLASTDYNAGLIETEVIMSTDVPKVFQARALNGVPMQTGESAIEYKNVTSQTIMQTVPQIRPVFVLNDKKKDDVVQPLVTDKKQLERGYETILPKEQNIGQPSGVLSSSNSALAMPSGLANMSTYGLVGYGTGFFCDT